MTINLPKESWFKLQKCWLRISKSISKLNEESLQEDIKVINEIISNNGQTVVENEIKTISSNELDNLMDEIDNETKKDSNDNAYTKLTDTQKNFISKPVCKC